MEIDYKLQKDIETYCELNEIEDVDKFASGLLRKAFNIEKYGERPLIGTQRENTPIIKVENKAEEKIEETVPEEVSSVPIEVTITKEEEKTVKKTASTEEKKEEKAKEEAPKKKRGRPKKKIEEAPVPIAEEEEKVTLFVDQDFFNEYCSICTSDTCDGTSIKDVEVCKYWAAKNNKSKKRKLS